ncbi:PAS domain S-box protein [Nostoc sp. FACHB-152]|uniref:PAS domain S-box protein n=1 Tax=unclassified Nostoc TaxID=2593658 RepID=UPI0016852A17|nr:MULTISPECIES: PAS domain S-box protein [unclassified Nostoc]MBD2450482.1 PAS domain S-box protein [Nostoc sp. FACHB-152]MBD2471703.1 PAS domain S-box protein [Nostoc sp. FACHB-145]
MLDQDKHELAALRQRVAELEELEIQYQYRQLELEAQLTELKAQGQTAHKNPHSQADMAFTLQQLQQEKAERQQIELALQDSEQLLKLAIDAAWMGFWDLDVATNKLIWSESQELLFGLTPGSFSGTYEAFLSRIHPDDRESVRERIASALADKIDYKDEFRVIWPNQSLHWISARGKFYYNQQGQAQRMLGVCMDISDQKQTEENTRQLTTQVQEQANLLNTILAASVDHIYIFDRAGRHKYVSHGGAAILGLKSQDLLGKALQELDLPGDFTAQVQMQQKTVIATGEPIKDECKLVTVDGIRYYEYIVTPLRDHNQSIEGVIIVSRDISEHKKVEQSLRESEARFRQLSESNLIGVAFWNMEGYITDANDAYLNLAGYTREEFAALGKIDWRKCTPKEYLHLDECALAEVQATGVSQIYEKEYIHRNGKRVPVVLGIALLNDSQDNGVAFVLDISDRKRAEQERDRLLEKERLARREAEVANRIKDEFLAVLSHELRTPLNPILGWAKLLRNRKFDEKTTKQALETIERNAKLQTQLIEDLLDVSRILQGKLSLNVCPVSLNMVVEAALDTVRLAAEAKSIQIYTLFDHSIGQVMGDPNRLQQVVWNLLSNAVKFTPAAGQVEIQVQEVDGQAQIRVSDTGKGITPEFLPYVFDYFRQADGTTTRKFGGLGLGLAIVRQVVEMHGGTVKAESPGEGLGVTFIVRIPLLVTNQQVKRDQQELPPDVSETPDLSGVKILVVDDEPDIRDLVTFILQDYGVDVTAVTSAGEALEEISQSLPDILISDIGMPEVDGYMLIRQLRQQPPEQGGNIPAIALTAYAGEMNQQQALASGFQMHVSKPVDPDVLVDAIVSLIKH